jgi:hypothetical protein
MPNFDGGHYFLTALIPIKSAEYVEQDGRKNSPVHMVRNALAVLPKARQSPVTEQTEFNSPFARNTRTHFARLVVIDDVINNGRNPVNALKVAIGSPAWPGIGGPAQPDNAATLRPAVTTLSRLRRRFRCIQR